MGDVTGAGTASIFGSSTIEFGAASAEDVLFDAAAAGTLRLDHSASYTGVISGFNDDDHLDLADFGAGATVSYVANADGTGGTLTVSDGAHTAALVLLGQFDPAAFAIGDDHLGGALITYAPGH